MNIKMQCCGIIILLILLYFFRKQKKLRLRTSIVYNVVLIFSLISLLLDITSLFAISYHTLIPQWLLSFSCKIYLMSLVGVAYLGLLYITSDIIKKKKDFFLFLKLTSCIVFIFYVLIAVLPIQYHIEEGMAKYTYGPSVIVTYIGAAGFVIANLIVAYAFKKQLNLYRYHVAQIWMLIWLTAAIIQFILNSLLIVGFASSLGLLIVYIQLENPDYNLERKTGLFNQNALVSYLKQCFSDNVPMSLLLLQWDDTDSFHLERSTIDAYRREQLNFLKKCPNCEIFRYTQEDIIFMFPNKSDAENAINIIKSHANTIKSTIPNYVCRYELVYYENCLITENIDMLFRMYTYIKRWHMDQMQNIVIRADKAMLDRMKHDKDIENLIEAAIENEERVQVYYQPIYSIKDQAFTSAEALIRLVSEDGNIVMPGEFIDIAERSGKISALGRIVFKKVCLFLRDYKNTLPDLQYIEVNLSIIQCANIELSSDFINIMKEYQIDPSWINFEITESTMVQDRNSLLKNMNYLLDAGTHFSLDDFGTGASNLNYVVDMPVRFVKFDRVMTMAYFENKKAKYVMEAAMMMIKGLKLKIVAEGIETREQYEIMKNLSINYIQGYYFSKPITKEKYIEFMLEKHNK